MPGIAAIRNNGKITGPPPKVWTFAVFIIK